MIRFHLEKLVKQWQIKLGSQKEGNNKVNFCLSEIENREKERENQLSQMQFLLERLLKMDQPLGNLNQKQRQTIQQDKFPTLEKQIRHYSKKVGKGYYEEIGHLDKMDKFSRKIHLRNYLI